MFEIKWKTYLEKPTISSTIKDIIKDAIKAIACFVFSIAILVYFFSRLIFQ